jgi:hypothetical protein
MSPALLARIEEELAGLEHGIVKVELHVRDGRLVRAVVGREASILLETESQSVGEAGNPAPRRVVTARGPKECDHE